MKLFDFFRKKEEPNKAEEVKQNDVAEEENEKELPEDYATSIIERQLELLHCKYKVQDIKDRNCKRYHFTFQACNFSMDAFKKSQSVYLLFSYVAVTQIDELELYKKVCMEMNYYQNPAKFVYYTDDEEGNVYININQFIHVTDDMAKSTEYLESAFENLFRLRHLMGQEIDQQRANQNYDKRSDYRKEVDSRMSYLLRQQEETNQYYPINRDSYREGQTLQGFINYFFGVRKSDIVSVRVVNDNEILTATAETIKCGDFNPDKYRVVDGVVEAEDGTVSKRCDNAIIEVIYNISALSNPTTRKIIISLTVEDDNENCIFVRATATQNPLSLSRAVTVGSKDNKPETYSVLICAEKNDKGSYEQEFDYIWNETKDMAENNDFDNMTDEQRQIYAITNNDVAYHVYWGTKLLTECRYYEAIFYLETAYNLLQDRYNQGDEHDKHTMAHVAYQLGFALNELGQQRRAIFYAEIGFLLGQKIAYTESYINSLVNSNDFRSLSVIDDHLRRTVEYEQQNGTDGTVAHLKNFLLRRKATALINQQLFHDAHEYLNELAKNPDCKDFASKEMNRLKKIEDVTKKN